MNNWETTIFGIMSAIGSVLAAQEGPHWLKLLGLCVAAAGTAGLGYTSASVRGVQKTLNNEHNEKDTTTNSNTPTS